MLAGRLGPLLWLAALVAAAAAPACSAPGAAPRAPAARAPAAPAPEAIAAAVQSAAYLRLTGAPAQALALLQPLAAHLDAAGLAELARAEAALGQTAEAGRVFARAAVLAERRAGQRGAWRWQHTTPDKIVRLAFSPDGTRLVSADRAGRVRVWDTADGHELVTLENAHLPTSLAMSPNGRWIAAAGDNGPLQVWSAQSGKKLLELPLRSPAAFTPDGTLLAATRTELVELSIPSGQELARFGKGSPSALAVGARIYMTSYVDVDPNDANSARQPVLTAWERGRAHRQIHQDVLPEQAWTLQLSARGELVMTSGDDLAIADEHGKPRHALGVYASPALSPDGARLVARPATGGADLIDAASGTVLRHYALGIDSAALAYHPRGGLFASAEGGAISLTRVATGELAARFGAPTPRRVVAFDANGDRLALGADAGPPTVWRLRDGAIDAGAATAPNSFAWSPGVQLASDYRTRATLDDGRVVTLSGQLKTGAAQPGRGDLLAASGDDGRISIWDVASGAPRRVLLDGGVVVALRFSPDGRVLASAAGSTVSLWDPRDGARLAALAAHAPITSVAFRPDGRTLAVACADGLVELRAVATGALVATLAAPASGRGIVIAPDGAVDGALADGDPLFWTAGAATLPARAAWDREARPGLLAARLRAVPPETAPRPGVPGAAAPPDPPACFAHQPADGPVRLITAEVTGDNSLSLCVEHERVRKQPELPTCFHLDLATAVYRPRPPEPDEALGWWGPPSITTKVRGTRVTVCKDGACHELTVPELDGIPDDKRGAAHVNRAGSLVAVTLTYGGADDDEAAEAADDDEAAAAAAAASGDHRPRAAARRRRPRVPPLTEGTAVIYDVARGRRVGRVDLGEPHVELGFLDETLLVTNTPCAGPCSTSKLIDPRTGKHLAMVGGADPINTSMLATARVAGDVYAFADNDTSTIVYQDLKTGRVVQRFEHDAAAPCDGMDCAHVVMSHVGGRLAVVQAGGLAGDVTLYDASGQLLVRYRLPLCEGASP